ncbi:MAG: tRNA threonylcarbamoyladenosine dehydratase [Salinivirgaceae bacterium]|nr:tRNA threonylcarbamoyladenosine dehydratase [Salinivirgaceae bacterium]
MDNSWLERTELLLGSEKLERLRQKHVLVVGLGGVGAYAAEMIARAGIGRMTIVDGDTVSNSNINRQLPALHSQVGKPKTEVMAARLRDINPDIDLTVVNEFIRDERMVQLLENKYDYVVDAIDTLSPKVFLIYHSIQMGLPIISSMGSGGKTDPTKLQIADISKTFNCKLARSIRKRLHRKGIDKGLTVVFSTELTDKTAVVEVDDEENKKSTVGTISYMPALFGIYCASKVIRDLAGMEQ